MAPHWDGEERRVDPGHDLLIEIHTDVKHIKRTNDQYGKDIGTLKTDVVQLQTIQDQTRSNSSHLTALAAVLIAGLALVKSLWK